jgi:hypothetical protein
MPIYKAYSSIFCLHHPADVPALHRAEAAAWARRLRVAALPTLVVAVMSMLPMIGSLRWLEHDWLVVGALPGTWLLLAPLAALVQVSSSRLLQQAFSATTL